MDVLYNSRALDIAREQRAVDVALSDVGVLVLHTTPSVDLPEQALVISQLLCDDVIAETWTEPAIVEVNVLASDVDATLPDATARISFHDNETSGSPCRVWWRLVNGTIGATYTGKNKGIEQTSPHADTFDIITAEHRDQTYDLWWKWTSGSVVHDWSLVAAAAVYVPPEGDGDYPNVYLPA